MLEAGETKGGRFEVLRGSLRAFVMFGDEFLLSLTPPKIKDTRCFTFS